MAASQPALSLDALSAHLASPLSSALGEEVTIGQISLLVAPKAVADDSRKLLVVDRRGRPVAVVLFASTAAPKLVAAGLKNAREAKAALGPEVGAVILDPLAEGEIDGVTWGALPHCHPLSETPVLRVLERRRLVPHLLAWLDDVVRVSVADPTPEEIRRDFLAPLEHLAALASMTPKVKAAAQATIDRLGRGVWRPKYVVAHNDFWAGNILLKHGSGRDSAKYGGCAVIDWPAARVRGNGMLDLTRLALSLRLEARRVRAHVALQCRMLGSELVDARSQLVVGLAHIRLSLEHFPEGNFIRMSEACLDVVAEAVGLPKG